MIQCWRCKCVTEPIVGPLGPDAAQCRECLAFVHIKPRDRAAGFGGSGLLYALWRRFASARLSTAITQLACVVLWGVGCH